VLNLARIHDLTSKNYKSSHPFSQGDHNVTGFKLVVEPVVRQLSMLFPPLDEVMSEQAEKSIPLKPTCTPKESVNAKNRNLWNTKIKRHTFILGKDTPTQKVLVGWVIPFKDGVVFKHAPAYREFLKRFKNSNLNLCIEWIIQNIEKLLQTFEIQYADVFCDKILALAQQPLVWPLLKDSLMMCIANPDEVIEKMNDPALKFKSRSNSREIAARVIQRAFRAFSTRYD
jgi:hypothetical protein